MYLNSSELDRLSKVCSSIIKNKYHSLDILLNELSNRYKINSIEELNIFFDKYRFRCNKLIETMGLIIKYLENKTNNIIDKRLEDVVMTIDFEILKPFETNCNYISYQIENVLDNGNEIISNVVNLILAGEKKEDALKNYNLSQNQFDTYVRKYLPSNPELWVKYKTYKSSAEIIKDDELEQYKCVLEYFIKNIEQAILTLKGTYVKGVACRNQMVYLKKILNQYKKCLETLNFEHSTPNNSIPDVEDFIKDYVLNINELLKIYNSLGNSNNMTEKNKKESKKLFKKQYNLVNKIK